ncbi:MAG: hypothetical protein MZV70_60800 [Desulfobacterales bacterium]|nr:hypothetical protein [Desulfobacterales bacterium]
MVAGGGADLMADVLSAVAKGAVLLTGPDDRTGPANGQGGRRCAGGVRARQTAGRTGDRTGPLVQHAGAADPLFAFRGERAALHERSARSGWVLVGPRACAPGRRGCTRHAPATAPSDAAGCGELLV